MQKIKRVLMQTLLGAFILGMIIPAYCQATVFASLWNQCRSQEMSLENFALSLLIQFGSIKGAVSGGLIGLIHGCNKPNIE